MKKKLLLPLFLVLFSLLCLSCGPSKETLQENSYRSVQHYINSVLKSPASAKYPKIGNPDLSISERNGIYTYSGYVDSQNSFGALLRMYYTMEVKKTDEKGEKWECLYFSTWQAPDQSDIKILYDKEKQKKDEPKEITNVDISASTELPKPSAKYVHNFKKGEETVIAANIPLILNESDIDTVFNSVMNKSNRKDLANLIKQQRVLVLGTDERGIVVDATQTNRCIKVKYTSGRYNGQEGWIIPSLLK